MQGVSIKVGGFKQSATGWGCVGWVGGGGWLVMISGGEGGVQNFVSPSGRGERVGVTCGQNFVSKSDG